MSYIMKSCTFLSYFLFFPNIKQDYYHDIFFQDFLQNADDANVTKFYIIIDNNCYKTNNLMTEEEGLKHWQGPAILIYNNETILTTQIQKAKFQSQSPNPKHKSPKSQTPLDFTHRMILHGTNLESNM